MLALALALIGPSSCGTGAASSPAQATPACVAADTSRLLHEHQFSQDPALRAAMGDTVFVRLEGKGATEVSKWDTGGSTGDAIPFRVEEPAELVVRVDAPTVESVRIRGEQGETIRLVHGEARTLRLTSKEFTLEVEPRAGQEAHPVILAPTRCAPANSSPQGTKSLRMQSGDPGTPGVLVTTTAPSTSAIAGVDSVPLFIGTGLPLPNQAPSYALTKNLYRTLLPHAQSDTSTFAVAVEQFFANGGESLLLYNGTRASGKATAAELDASIRGAFAISGATTARLLVVPELADQEPDDYVASVSTITSLLTDQSFSFLVLDAPSALETPSAVAAWLRSHPQTLALDQAAMYWPVGRVQRSDGTAQRPFVSGAMAGLLVAGDMAKGPWASPVATAALQGVSMEPSFLSDEDSATLREVGINPVATNAEGLTTAASAFTLHPTSTDFGTIGPRRLTNYIARTLYIAIMMFVFEPNDSLTWSIVQTYFNSFLNSLWVRGAFFGETPSAAYKVACGLGTTMSALDVLNGYLVASVAYAARAPNQYTTLTYKQAMQGP